MPAATRFMRAGTTKVYWVPTVASAVLAPTAAEVLAGTNLTADIATMTGFSFANSPIKIPDMATTFEASIPGRDTADDSNIEFYQGKGTDATRTAMVKGTAGFIVILYDGTAGAAPAAADKVDVWPATIASNAKIYTADNEAAKYRVVYGLTAAPGIEKALT